MKIFAVIIPVILVCINGFILISSETKIKKYNQAPPFFATDFTKSYKLNQKSQIKFIVDGDTETFWTKEREAEGADFEVELRLTHYFQNGLRSKDYRYLKIVACEKAEEKISKPEKLEVSLFLKEAINVDKELRLPSEKIAGRKNLDFSDSPIRKIDVSKELRILETNHFPENVFIIGVRGKITGAKKSRPCISEISLEK